ncbi:MAG: heterocyst differentiation control protein [Leptolyngbyaceae bacterium]|nr:heterocyst differentiation control protein [Leptolyngbyaceae bacterium]
MDQIMFYLAFSAIRNGGHRHGTFLNAAATAAKCAVYMTYLEQNESLRKTGFLHHIEPKRVKEIIEEIRLSLTEGKLLKLLGAQEPDYLMQLPHYWLTQYPEEPGGEKFAVQGLSADEKKRIQSKLKEDYPSAKVIGAIQLLDMIEDLHGRSQQCLAEGEQVPLSESLAEHIRRQLIHSGTIIKIDVNSMPIALYALARESYSPAGKAARTRAMIEDTARFFSLMRQWTDRQPRVLRVVEELDIPSEQIDEALDHLDRLMNNWANQYHKDGGETFIVHLCTGAKPNE